MDLLSQFEHKDARSFPAAGSRGGGRRPNPRARPQPRWFSALFLAGAVALGGSLPAARTLSATPNEYQVKAAFLYNFAKFVEWPPGTFAGPNAPLVVEVLGEDPFGQSLDEAIGGRSVNGHPLLIHRSRRLEDLRGCQLLFVSSAEQKRMPLILARLEGWPVLTVGEWETFAESGGIIQFLLEDNRVRFAINLDAATRARLKISSKLLTLAKIMREEAHAKRG